MRTHAGKRRLIITSALAALGVPTAICTILAAHTALDVSLNLLWFLLAIGAFAHWAIRGSSKCRSHLPELVSLIFMLSLLFPVIWGNDDWVVQYLIDDANTSQSVVTSLKSENQYPAPGTSLRALAAVEEPSLPSPLPTFKLAAEAVAAADDAPAVHATGNHSPPA